MGRAARNRRRQWLSTMEIRAVEPEGPILCAAETVVVEQAIEAAEGKTAKRPSFNILAYTGGLLRVGWSRPLVVDLAGIRAGRTTVLLDHDPSQIVGQGQASIADGKINVAGEITGEVSAETPSGQVVSHARNGFLWAASIGMSPERIEPVDANQQITVNGREFSGPIYVVRAGRLGEVSFVGVGADEQAVATVAANRGKGDEAMTFEQWLKAKGLAETAMKPAEYQALLAQFQQENPNATVTAAAQPASMPAATVTAAAPSTSVARGFEAIDREVAEGKRIQAIQDLALAAVRNNRDPIFAEGVRELMARAIDAKTSVRDFEMELLRFGYGRTPVQGEPQVIAESAQTLTAAALLACGHSGDSILAVCGERAVHAADRQFRGNLGLHELMLRCANANGYVGRQNVSTSNWREVLNWCIPDVRVRASGLSSIDLSGILGAVANKAMGAVAAEPQWLVPALCGTASHTNFHSHTVYSLAMNGELTEVAPSGELDHVNLSQDSYTRQVKTRGAVLRLSRTDVINDDLNVFSRNAQTLARKSYTTREKVFFTLLMASGAGASHFTAARGNYLTGATTAFGQTGLGTAIKGFRALTGPDGDPIMVEPEVLLVPPTLEAEARALLTPSSPLVVSAYSATNARVLSPSANIYAGRFGASPLCSSYLEWSTITGNSTAYWYLFANPNVYPCYEIAYLNGQQQPTIEYFGLEAEADTLGVAWRVYWDFGVAAAEWRAGVKLAGS